MTIIRAERPPGQSQNGFVKADVNEYFHSTNVFGTMLENDYMEWDLTNPDQPVINQRMTWGAAGNEGDNSDGTDNLSVARAFPFRVLGTAFGKIYDCYGYNQSPRLVDADPALGDRGYVWETAPAVDLRAVTTLVGYPAPISNLPNTVVRIDAVIDSGIYNNLLIDMYSNYDPDPPSGYNVSDPLNDNIHPPYSKFLNLQVQMDRGRVRPNDNAHAWGYSGATVLGTAVIDGQLWRYGHKQETLNNNNFPFISFCGWDGTNNVVTKTLNAKNMWQWVLDNWSTILTQADAAGVSYGDVTHAKLLQSYCDGIHAGSEVLGPGTGSITFNELAIEIIDDDDTTPITPGVPTTPDEIPEVDYTAWLNDPANDCYRLFLAEVDHSGGTLTYANKGWLSDGNVPYYERLIESPVYREGLTGLSAGSMDVSHPLTEVNINQYSIHGHEVRWFNGDERWSKNRFRQILTTQSQGAPQYQSQGVYRIGLVSQTEKYRIKFLTGQVSYDDSALNVIADVLNRASAFDTGIRTYSTAGNVNLLTELRFDADENTVLDDLLVSIASSVNCWRRISQDGLLEFVSKDREITSTYTFNQSSIDGSTIRQIASIDPVATVNVPYFNGSEPVETGAAINNLSTDVTIDSLLKNQADALTLGGIEAQRFARPQNRYLFELLDRADEINIADYVFIDHGEFGGKAYISNIERRILQDTTLLEVTI